MSFNSASVSTAALIVFIIVIAVFAAVCFIQTRLSRKPLWTMGLIIPAANILLSVFVLVLFTLYSSVGMIKAGNTSTVSSGEYNVTVYSDGSIEAYRAGTGESVQFYTDDRGMFETGTDRLILSDEEIGKTLAELHASENHVQTESGDSSGLFGGLLSFFLLNIPTIAYLVIYFIERRGVRSSSQLEKIQIQDL